MKHSYSIKVQEVKKETDNCVSIAFDIPEDLKSSFQYKSGQYLNLICSVDGQELHRSYSLCSSPLDNEWRVAVKKVAGGKFSTYANEKLKVGDILDVMLPDGKFYPNLNHFHQKSYLLIAAGSGITPIISIAKSILFEEPNSEVILLFGNSKMENIIFKESLLALKNEYLTRFQLHFLFSKTQVEEELFYGRIGLDKIKQFNKLLFDLNEINDIFICGPEEMILELKDGLVPLINTDTKIHIELFGTNVPKAKVEPTESQKGKDANVKLKLDGKIFEFPLSFGTQSILDAALAQKANLPYACKGGVCCTCKAKLIEGKVNMAVNYGLEADEIEAGFILTCQSYPITEKIVVDFDA